MFNRRLFLKSGVFSGLALLLHQRTNALPLPGKKRRPVVISTWQQNTAANAAAFQVLSNGGKAIDAVEAGIMIPEADPDDQSVGYGGLPDRDGVVSLDACIMNERGDIGAVMALEGIRHPIKLARLVMEQTPHVQLAGEGALQFALANGFKRENLLSPAAEKAWQEWKVNAQYDPMTIPGILQQPGQQHNHDTIGMIALDVHGNLGGGCSSSGMAFKMKGRIGDSPIIGAGLYVDNEVGAATCSGVGEEVVRICGAHTVVEMMRQGYLPEQACRKALERLVRMRGNAVRELQIGFIAMSNQGSYGAYALQKGFTYAAHTEQGVKTYRAKSLY